MLQFDPLNGTELMRLNPTLDEFELFTHEAGMDPYEPVIAVGESFSINSPAPSVWQRTFSVWAP